MEGLHHHADLTGIAGVVFAALALGMVMARLRQPALVGYILAGVILGPSGLGAVENREIIQLMAELGVLLLLFLIGMELSLRGFKEVWKVAAATTFVQIGVGVGATALLAQIFDWSIEMAIVVGFCLALSSTAVAIKMLEATGDLRNRIGQVTVGVLIAQDLAVVPMMLIVSTLGGNQGEGGVDPYTAGATVAISIITLAALIFYLSRRKRIRLPFDQIVGKSTDLIPLAGLFICFGAAAVSGVLGLSPAYGAFLAGLLIGNSTARAFMLRHTAPIQSVLLMVFFLSIGLLIDLRYIVENLGTVISLLLLIMVVKTAINVVAIKLFGESWPRAFLSGAALAQVGEFSFILAAIGLSVGALSLDDNKLIVSVTVLSLIAAPIWLSQARRLHRIGMLGVTSWRETMRLTVGQDARKLRNSRRRAVGFVSELRDEATRLIDSITPMKRRPSPKGDEREENPPAQ